MTPNWDRLAKACSETGRVPPEIREIIEGIFEWVNKPRRCKYYG